MANGITDPSEITRIGGVSSSIAGAGATVATLLAHAGVSLFATGGALAAAPATLGISAAVAGLVALAGQLFHGANPLQVPVAQIQQAFILAADNLNALAREGFISSQVAAAGMQVYITELQNANLAGKYGKAGAKGLAGAVATIQAEMSGVLGANYKATRPYTLAQARAAYYSNSVPVGAGKWYKVSVDAAKQLTDQYMSSLPQDAPLSSPSIGSNLKKAGGVAALAVSAVALVK